MDKLGELLIALRKKNNLSQKQLADALHVSPSAISKWENNQNHPDLAQVPLIAELLKVSCDELLHPSATLANLEENHFPNHNS